MKRTPGRRSRARLRYLGFRGRWRDDEVRRVLAREDKRDALFRRDPGHGVLLPVESSEQEVDDARDTRTHWVEIVMVGEDDEPLPGVKYEIELPDGTLRRGTLNGRGEARVEGIEGAGTCKVRFPALDGEAWRPI